MKKIHVSTLEKLENAVRAALSGQYVDNTTRYIEGVHYVTIQGEGLRLLILRYWCGEVNIHSIVGESALRWCAEITNELWRIGEAKGEILWTA